jgi:hypothetical protein
MAPSVAGTRFPLAWQPAMSVLARMAGVSPANAWVEVTRSNLMARFGPWRLETPVSNIASAEITGPYQLWKVAGPARLSFADRGLTFAGTTERGVCLQFRQPVRGIDPLGALLHPGLTVTVADPPGLIAALEAAGLQATSP